jgi:hypothetical protein
MGRQPFTRHTGQHLQRGARPAIADGLAHLLQHLTGGIHCQLMSPALDQGRDACFLQQAIHAGKPAQFLLNAHGTPLTFYP